MYEVTGGLNKITEETGESIQFRVNPIFLVEDTAGTLSGTNLQYGYGAYSDYNVLGITPPSNLSFTASGVPDGALFDKSTGVFTWKDIAETHNNQSYPIVFGLTANYPTASGGMEVKSIQKTLTIDIKALVSNETQTATGTATVPSTQQKISISLTTPKQAYSNTATISGLVTKEAITTNKYNFSYVIDVSGSMNSTFSGSETINDVNGNGHANELLDGAIIAFEALNQDLIKAGFGSANLRIIKFNSSATSIYDGLVSQTSSISNAFRQLRNGGGTNFKVALAESINFFNGKKVDNNFLFFLSDGVHSQGYGSFSDEVSTLRSHNVTIRAIGLGENASLDDLRIMDGNAQKVLAPSTLTAGLAAPSVSNVDRVEINVNQVLVKTIPKNNLEQSAVGFKYKVDLTTLIRGQDDEVEAHVIANDIDATTASAKLTIKE
jgi:hypothetical protein